MATASQPQAKLMTAEEFMAADLGCSMETVMAHYLSNHIAVAYGDIFGEMVALSCMLGFNVRVMQAV